MLRMNDHPHEELGAAELSRDEGICDHQPPRRLVRTRARGGLRIDRAGAESPAVPPVEQGTKGHREELPGQSHGSEPRPDDATDPALDRDQADREEADAVSVY